MKNKRTNWSKPNRTWLGGINNLRLCLASGTSASLVKEFNENCEFPIPEKRDKVNNKVSEWKSTSSYMMTENEILNSNLSDFEKNLKLNYKNFYGNKDAVNTYNKTGKLSKGNFIGVGRSHLVLRQDAIDYYNSINDKARADLFKLPENKDESHWFDNHTKIGINGIPPRKFKNKIWVVEINDDDVPTPLIVKLLNVIYYPLKFIPTKRVLKMDKYKMISFTVGDVTNGFSIEFQIPKKFSFK